MNSIQLFLKEHNVPIREGGTHQHVGYGWIGVQCPWCRTSNWHLGIKENGLCFCWRCGSHRLGDVLMMLTGLDWSQVKNTATQTYSLAKGFAPRTSQRVILPPGIQELGNPHIAYLKSRGFDHKAISRIWGVRGIGQAPRLKWRLWIPIRVRNEIVSWTTRTIGTTGIRYLKASKEEESISGKKVLYGAELARHSIVVVEGPTDAWRIGPGAVATLGMEVTESQISEIGAYPVRAICFDRSPTAQKRAKKLVSRLDMIEGETFIIEIESGDDPGDMDELEVAEIKNRFLE